MSAVGSNKPSRRFAIGSIILAALSLLVAPGICAVLGILLGMVAISKGDRYLGMLGVVASAVLGFTGYYIAGALAG
jgi:hypothetical protein